MPKISIIVPVYNVENYLSKCINSILDQTFSDFELILIDDKSPDKSGKICDDYAKRDNRIMVIHKETNQGVSAARNDGLDVAKGEYVTFVDSDDWVEPDFLEYLYGLAVEKSADIVTCTLQYDGDAVKFGRTLGTYEGIEKQKNVSIRAEDFSWGKWYSFDGAACKLYVRNLIEKNNIRFNLLLSNGEDALFYANVMLYSKHCVASTKALYHYFIRANGASNLRTKKQYASTAKAWHMIMQRLDTHWNSYYDSGRMLLWNLFHYVNLLKCTEIPDYRQVLNIQKMFRFLRKHNYILGSGMKFSVVYMLLEWNIPLHRKILERKVWNRR